MLELVNIRKEYVTGDNVTVALKNVSVKFRENEFVSILGPSGCGKTTLLNIVGGLDRYTDGDLIINGKSTKEYKDRDWDVYRNHTIGFVFQTYNLIMHLTVLENVELALTLSGINESERRQRTIEVLEKVGLSDKLNSRPNQLSGGQMQRVAIARALVNNPDILLADEPTGALDSTTSVQIMELLKEIAKEKLVIMVTHNPELADEYSTRIIRIKDGELMEDSNPCEEVIVKEKDESTNKTSMSFMTALKLSFRNLLTKKARTLLVTLAGSIGIIGIALIMSMSNGFQTYINNIQEDTLTSYPLIIEKHTTDPESLFLSVLSREQEKKEPDGEKVYVNNIFTDLYQILLNNNISNDLVSFKSFLDNNKEIQSLVTDIKYEYNADLNIYKQGVNNNGITEYEYQTIYPSSFGMPQMSGFGSVGSWGELIDNDKLIENQYELVAGSYPKNTEDVVIILDSDGQISDIILLMLGLRSLSDFADTNKELKNDYTYEELLSLEFLLLADSQYYQYDEANNKINHITKDDSNAFRTLLMNESKTLRVCGIVRPNGEASMTSMFGSVGYTEKLVNYIVNTNENSVAIQKQLEEENINLVTGEAFALAERDKLLDSMGFVDSNNPDSIQIYPTTFEAKERIIEIITEYNSEKETKDKINYTDYVAVMISSVNDIVNAVSYVLIAFVSISLIVSSIMIGVITYISVLERTKEIGILRSIGASKKDISRVFNAETLIIGFGAGVLGIGISLLLLIPINFIIEALTSIANMGKLPLAGGIGLIIISALLTIIAGIIPSRIASKKDPVIALRSE